MDRAFRLMLATMLLASSGCIRWPDGDMRAGAPAGRGGSTGGRSTSPVSTSASSSLPIVGFRASVLSMKAERPKCRAHARSSNARTLAIQKVSMAANTPVP